MLYENIPFYWDAWDLMPYHLEKGRLLNGSAALTESCEAHIVEPGPFRASVRCRVRVSENSEVIMHVQLTAFSPLLTFDVEVDWHESRKILKVRIPCMLTV
jgi:alpha-mannosidase